MKSRVGACVCLHKVGSARRRTTEPRHLVQRVRLHGDGAAEVVYTTNALRVYDGTSGGVYLALPSLNRTITENPVVADVDNDGNAEIVLAQNNEDRKCDETTSSRGRGVDDVPAESLPNGLEVWGDRRSLGRLRAASGTSTHHVTNVTEGGAVPLTSPRVGSRSTPTLQYVSSHSARCGRGA